jgi:hypothetical protein
MLNNNIISQLILLITTMLYVESTKRPMDYQWCVISLFLIRLFFDKSVNKKLLFCLVILFKALLIPLSFVLFSICSTIHDYNWVCQNVRILYDVCFDVTIINKSIMKYDKPVIYMCNYPESSFEYHAIHLLSNKLCIVSSSSSVKFIEQFWSGMNSISVKQDETNNLNKVSYGVKNMVSQGYDILVYPKNVKNEHQIAKSNKRKRKLKFGKYSQLQSGLFVISEQLNVPIVPVFISPINHINGIVINCDVNIYIDKPLHVKDVKESMIHVDKFFSRCSFACSDN